MSDPLGLSLLGHLYLKGRGVEKDEVKALKYIQAGADRGSPLGQAMLGVMYEHGIEVEEDEKKAFELYKKAADQELIFGIMRYARCYWEGIGVEEDRAEGKKQVLRIVKKGMPAGLKVFTIMTRKPSWGWDEFFFNEDWNPGSQN
jgi:TPR repeat protein